MTTTKRKKRRRNKRPNPRPVTLQDGTVRWTSTAYLKRPDMKSPLWELTFDYKKDAERWLHALRSGSELPATDRRPLREFLLEWLADKAAGVVGKRGAPRTRTMSDYERTLERWLIDPPEHLVKQGLLPLGHCKLMDLSVHKINTLYKSMTKQCAAKPYAVRVLHGVLRQALEAAVHEELLPRNPAKNAKVPRKSKSTEQQAMTAEEARVFLEAARKLFRERNQYDQPVDRYSALWHVLVDGGLRPGEAFGLEWRSVNWEDGAVEVTQALVRARGKGWCLEAPKTKGSVRTVPLNDVPMQELKLWRKHQMKMRMAAGAEWQEHGHDFVFTTTIGSPLDGARRSFRRVCEEAGLGEYGKRPPKRRSGPQAQAPFKCSYTLYQLRHTAASLMDERGVPHSVIAERLGNSPEILKRHYVHVQRKRVRAATEEYGKVLFGT